MHMQYTSAQRTVKKPKQRMTTPMFQTCEATGLVHSINIRSTLLLLTNVGSCSCSTMMNPMATKMMARLTRTIRQHTPLVFGQNGFGADIVSTTTPAFVVLLGSVEDGWLLALFELILYREGTDRDQVSERDKSSVHSVTHLVPGRG